jgi:hypothetical protein
MNPREDFLGCRDTTILTIGIYSEPASSCTFYLVLFTLELVTVELRLSLKAQGVHMEAGVRLPVKSQHCHLLAT